MKVLITGVAGFIGSHLAEHLLSRGSDVIGIDNFNDYYDPRLKRLNLEDIKQKAQATSQYFQSYSGDIGDTDLLSTLFSEHRIDCVIHLAAMAGVRPSLQQPLLYERVNGLGTYALLEAMRQAGVRNMVFGSSSSVYGLNTKVPFSEDDPVNQPYSPYAQTKRANELNLYVYHKVYAFNCACLRFFTVYGPRQRPDLAIRKFTTLMFEGKSVPILGDGSFKRDYTYIDDIIDGALRAIDWVMGKKQPQYEIFNLGENATTSVIELITLIEKASGITAKKLFSPPQPGDVPITYADISKAKRVLGYTPTTPINEGIPKFITWLTFFPFFQTED